jgi:hypothetical protein
MPEFCSLGKQGKKIQHQGEDRKKMNGNKAAHQFGFNGGMVYIRRVCR